MASAHVVSSVPMKSALRVLLALPLLLLAACASLPRDEAAQPSAAAGAIAGNGKGTEVVLFAMSLMDTGYRFGGKNPEAGLDCSGMVSYIYEKAAGVKLEGNAAQMARQGRPVAFRDMEPGDLVFFNTRNRPRSHVGIYVGEGRFVHAPQSRGRVKLSSLRSGYFAERFEEARRFLD
jgi:cell wall-associated NlpC family hydrolase